MNEPRSLLSRPMLGPLGQLQRQEVFNSPENELRRCDAAAPAATGGLLLQKPTNRRMRESTIEAERCREVGDWGRGGCAQGRQKRELRSCALPPAVLAAKPPASAAPSLRWVAQRPLPAHGASRRCPQSGSYEVFHGWNLRMGGRGMNAQGWWGRAMGCCKAESKGAALPPRCHAWICLSSSSCAGIAPRQAILLLRHPMLQHPTHKCRPPTRRVLPSNRPDRSPHSLAEAT